MTIHDTIAKLDELHAKAHAPWRYDSVVGIAATRPDGSKFYPTEDLGEQDELIVEIVNRWPEVRAYIAKLERRISGVGEVLSANGCDCDCNHDPESHDDDCVACLACQVQDRLL